jgi:hypothetical protein
MAGLGQIPGTGHADNTTAKNNHTHSNTFMFIVMQQKSLFWIKNDVFIFRIYVYL